MSHPQFPRHKGYVRSMNGWWNRNPFFQKYILREVTSFGVEIYAVILTWGLVSLARGEEAWNGWLAAMQSPWSVLLHVLLAASMAIHAWSWFAIMPKTMPMVFIGHERLKDATITRTGWAVAVVATLVSWLIFGWWQS